MILFLHGFNSTPSFDDINYLEKRYPDEEIYAPFLDYTDNKALDIRVKEIIYHCHATESGIIIVAKSLGCILARYFSWLSKGMILINPAFGYMDVLDKYKTEEYLINFRDHSITHHVDVDFLENIASYERSAPSLGHGFAYLCADDEILDHELVEREANKNYRVLKIQGTHSIELDDVPLLSDNINFLKLFEVM